jgi:hypothetical protein
MRIEFILLFDYENITGTPWSQRNQATDGQKNRPDLMLSRMNESPVLFTARFWPVADLL